MTALPKAHEPFRFFTRLHLSELTGLRASNLEQLLSLIKEVPGSAIYHHTHRLLQQHQTVSPEPPNDFAFWVSHVLGEDMLGEQLASINIIQFPTIRQLRERIVAVIEMYMESNLVSKLKFAREGQEFHFIKSVSFIIPTSHVATDLGEFRDLLRLVTIDSIYFHVFEARLRLEKAVNDFSNWIEHSLGDRDLASSLGRIDPYTYTLDDLRKKMIELISKKIENVYESH